MEVIRWADESVATDWRVETGRWPGVTTLYTAVGDVYVWLCTGDHGGRGCGS